MGRADSGRAFRKCPEIGRPESRSKHQATMQQQQQMKRPSESDDTTRAAKKTGTIQDVIPHEDVLRASIKGKFSGPAMDKLWDSIGDREIISFAGKLARSGKRMIDLMFTELVNELCFETGTWATAEQKCEGDKCNRCKCPSAISKIIKVHLQEFKACIPTHGIKQYTVEAVRRALRPHRCVVLDEFIVGLAGLVTEQDWSEESVFDMENYYKEGSEEIDEEKVISWLECEIGEMKDPQGLRHPTTGHF